MVNTRSFQDTLLMSYFVNNGLTKHNLEDLYFYYFGNVKEKFRDVIKNESKKKYKDFSEVPLQSRYETSLTMRFQLYNYLIN